ncbi:MAG: hypothetical protein ACYDAY_01765 [Candidatus Dormibacteria bacterium]
MLAPRTARRDNDFLMVIAVLALAIGGLASILVAGTPRTIATVIISAVAVPVMLSNWRLGPVLVLIIQPFYSELRRLLLLLDPTIVNLDPLVLLPDILASVMLVRILIDYLDDPAKAKATWFSTRADRVLMWLAVWSMVMMLQPVHFNPLVRLNGFRGFVLNMLLFWFYRRYWMEWRWVKAMMWITVVSGILSALYGIYQVEVGFPQWDQIYIDNTAAQFQSVGTQLKIFSTMQYSGQFSGYMYMAIIVALGAIQMKQMPLILRGLAIVSIPLEVIALANTFVRSSYVAAAAGVAVMLILALRSPLFRAVLVAGGVLALIAVQLGFGFRLTQDQVDSSVAQRATSVFNPSDTTYQFRINAIGPAFISALGTGGVGAGLGNAASGRFGDEALVSGGEVELLQTLVEEGFPGLALELLFLGLLFYQGTRLYLKAPDRDSAALGRTSLALCASVIVAGLSGTTLHTSPGPVYFWFMAAWALGLPEFFPKPKTEVERRSQRRTLLTTAA